MFAQAVYDRLRDPKEPDDHEENRIDGAAAFPRAAFVQWSPEERKRIRRSSPEDHKPMRKLPGKHGLGADVLPPQETALDDDEIVFCRHAGRRTVEPTWPTFPDYAERNFVR